MNEKQDKKEIDELTTEEIDEIGDLFKAGFDCGRDEARQEILKLIEKWRVEERVVLSYTLFLIRVFDELGECIKPWELKTTPLEEVKKKLSQDAESTPEGSSYSFGIHDG